MQVTTFIASQKKLTDSLLTQFLDQKKVELEAIDPALTDLSSAIASLFSSGGKRLRPLLFRLGYQLSGHRPSEAVTKASLFVELMHSYILVHDDIADRDLLRYGQPTLEIVFGSAYQKKYHRPNTHYGQSIAMVTGDLINALAHQALVESGLSSAQVHTCQSIMAHTLNQVVGGWYLHQLQNHQPLDQVQPQRYLDGMKLVSASYTVEAPLKMGLKIAPDNQVDGETVSQYAYHIGMGFQIQDDILGVFGDSKVTGKPVGNDLREGKKTLLVLEAFKNSSPSQQQKLASLLGTDLTEEQLTWIQDLISRSGALDSSRQRAITHVNHAIKAINKAGGDPETTEVLVELADFMIRRDS